MAALSSQDRAEVHAEFMRNETDTFGAVTKADLLAAVNALDAYFDGAASAINTAIPQPARGVLTVEQKSRLVRYVLRRRYG